MEAKELRIGNLVLAHINNEKCIHAVQSTDIVDFENGEVVIEPIPLTEELLVRFGFKKRNDGDYDLFEYSEVDIVINNDFDCWKCEGVCFSVNNIQYVHQLQNLYFALTGTELTISL